MSFGNQTSEKMITVEADSKIEIPAKAINDTYNAPKKNSKY